MTKKYMKYRRPEILSQHKELVLGKIVEGGDPPKEELLALSQLK